MFNSNNSNNGEKVTMLPQITNHVINNNEQQLLLSSPGANNFNNDLLLVTKATSNIKTSTNKIRKPLNLSAV